MTTDELARAYFQKARIRRKVLAVLFEASAWSDVVREAQELVELALKGALRAVGIDPPKWHDVGPVLLDNAESFGAELRADLPRLASISAWLRKEREFSFYGEVDFVPTEQYTREDAQRAIDDALWVVERIGVLDRDA